MHAGGGGVSNPTCSHYAENQRGTASTGQVHPTHGDLETFPSVTTFSVQTEQFKKMKLLL